MTPGCSREGAETIVMWKPRWVRRRQSKAFRLWSGAQRELETARTRQDGLAHG